MLKNYFNLPRHVCTFNFYTLHTVLFHYHIYIERFSFSPYFFIFTRTNSFYNTFFFHIFSSFYPLTPFSYNFYKKLHIITLLSLLFFTVFVLLFFYLIVIFPPPAPYFKYRPYILSDIYIYINTGKYIFTNHHHQQHHSYYYYY